MNLLDTDVLTHLQKNDPDGAMIAAQLVASPDQDFRITAVNTYEMLVGAFDLVCKLQKTRKALIPGFKLLQELLDYLLGWQGRILPYDLAADQVYRGFPPRLRQELGNDARIAAIALAHGAAVWTCNVKDYKRLPGLVVYAAKTGTQTP